MNKLWIILKDSGESECLLQLVSKMAYSVPNTRCSSTLRSAIDGMLTFLLNSYVEVWTFSVVVLGGEGLGR